MELVITPEQPEYVAEAIAALVTPSTGQPDPWWRAGLDEALYDES